MLPTSSSRRVTFLLFALAGLSACAVGDIGRLQDSAAGLGGESAGPGTDSGLPAAWGGAALPGIREGAHAFLADGAAFTATSPERDISGRFEPEGAALAHGGGALRVRTVGLGRQGAATPVPPVPPTLGACVPRPNDETGACGQRLEYATDALTEWWVAGADGFEQGWTLTEPPTGEGELLIHVAIDGTAAVQNDGLVYLEDDAGARWFVRGLVATDADGASLPARFVPAGGGFAVTVDDDSATYPIEIDPVYVDDTSVSAAVLSSESVQSAGDINGDGYDDVLVVSESYSKSWLFLGSDTGLDEGTQHFSNTGITAVGDLDKDGEDDGMWAAFGRVYRTKSDYRSLADLSQAAGATSVFAAGDVNGDGYADFLGQAGSTITLYSGTAITSGTSSTTVLYTFTLSGIDYMKPAGDIDHDGKDDVLLVDTGNKVFFYQGAVVATTATDGSVTSTTSLILSAVLTNADWEGVDGTTSGMVGSSNFGDSASAAGDVNGDGYDDVIVGDTYAKNSSGEKTGRAAIYHGSYNGLCTAVAFCGLDTTDDTTDDETATPDEILDGKAANNYFGYSVSGAGDVNADGYDDIVVGAYGAKKAYVYHGSKDGVSDGSTTTTTLATTLTGTAGSFGYSVSGAGDVHGDGYDDVIIGSSERPYLYHGYADEDKDGSDAFFDCDDEDPERYPAATEVPGDGVDQDCDYVDDCYTDLDGDNGGTLPVIDGLTLSCSADAGRAPIVGDCDEGNTLRYPGNTEIVANGVDEDCDNVDSCYTDTDGDNHGTTVVTDGSTIDCVTGAGAANNDDCDDGSRSVYLGATETPGDDIDQDCDGVDSCYTDADGDNYGSTVVIDGDSLYCDLGTGAATNDDCDDASADDHPGVTETIGNNDDDDCDGGGGELCFHDDDNDGYLDAAVDTLVSADSDCTDDYEAASTVPRTDCNDDDPSLSPAGTEIPADGIDQDCDNVDSCYTDLDRDNYGTASVTDGSSLNCDTGSGAAVSTDCNDFSNAIYPGATEIIADGIDQDCDNVDSCYTDADGDNYGSTDVSDGSTLSCSTGDGAVTNDDCDDTSATVYRGAPEVVADGIDQDCDAVDSCFRDADRDNFGTTVVIDGSSLDCESGTGAPLSTDCNDRYATIYPGAAEVTADGIDQDCDDVDSCYTDADGDNFGTTEVTVGSSTSCSSGTGAELSTDCDDTSAAIYPDAAEITADGIDQDCDRVDSCYTDADGDNYGTSVVTDGSSVDCVTGTGAALSTDCNDRSAAISPGVSEAVADGIDQDCDDVDSCYTDSDGDNYGTTVVVDGSSLDCALGSGAANDDDCDDGSSADHPGAAETIGNSDDEDCDTHEICLDDDDDDGFLDATADTRASDDDDCSDANEGSSADLTTDCDDGDATHYPTATDTPGNGLDENCDGAETCYVDADDDGYRADERSTVASADSDCSDAGEALSTLPVGDCDDASASYNPAAEEDDCADPADYDCDGTVVYSNLDGDAYAACEECDDYDPTVFPGAAEIPGDEVDQDCDGRELCFEDADGDGYRPDATSTVLSADLSCAGEGEALAAAPTGDCDDREGSVHPDASDLTGDAVDSDCDGQELCLVDGDSDGYVLGDGATVNSADGDCSDAGEALATALAGDCDDAAPGYNPGAAESDCTDPADYNCDGSVGYADADADGWAACAECDDADAAIHPNASELPGDRVDQDCDNAEDCYLDADADGYLPDPAITTSSNSLVCDGEREALASAPAGDCNDTDAAVNPSASERPGDELDQDCDGTELCYTDGDADGYRAAGDAEVTSADVSCDGAGEASADTLAGDCDDASVSYHPGAVEDDCTDPNDYNCDGSAGRVDADADGFAACEECNDAYPTVNPDASEVCNALDDDCDGTVDADSVDATLWYADADRDGYTTEAASVRACAPPAGYAALTALDCDDADNTSYPDGQDLPGDGVDQNCDGADATSPTDEGTATACGCTSTPDASGIWLLGWGVAAVLATRRRSNAP
jgi:hypothetical protein